MKVLSDSNYIIRKVGTHKTQCVHRMRLRLFKPELPSMTSTCPNIFTPIMKGFEDTDILVSSISMNNEVDQDKNSYLDQDLVDNESPTKIANRQPTINRARQQERTPEIDNKTKETPLEIEYNDHGPFWNARRVYPTAPRR